MNSSSPRFSWTERTVQVLLLLLVVCTPALGWSTDVIGNINVNMRWTTDGSPYVLLGDVTVAEHASLTIEPGVVVRAAASDQLESGSSSEMVELVIRGSLVANGTADAAVVIRGESDGADSWCGIVLEHTASATTVSDTDDDAISIVNNTIDLNVIDPNRHTTAGYGIHVRNVSNSSTFGCLRLAKLVPRSAR